MDNDETTYCSSCFLLRANPRFDVTHLRPTGDAVSLGDEKRVYFACPICASGWACTRASSRRADVRWEPRART